MMYYFLKLYKLGALGFVGLLMLICIVCVIRLGSVEALKKKLTMRHKASPVLIALILAAVVAANLFYSMKSAERYGTVDILLDYNQASSGLNPNGTRYNAADILCDEVLNDVLTHEGYENLTVDMLRSCLKVYSPIQGDSTNPDNYFISTQYCLRYDESKDTAGIDAEELLKVVAESYREWFIREYAEYIDVLDEQLVDFSQLDYLDICEYFEARAEMIYKFMNRLDAKEQGFTAASNGENFRSVSQQAMNINQVMIERLKAFVMENGVSKNPDAYVGRLGIQNVFSYFSELEMAAYNRNALTAVSMYEEDMARIVLVPTYDGNDQFYMSETRIGLDDYAEEARSYAAAKNAIRSRIAANKYIIGQMSVEETEGGIEKAEQLVEQINAELHRVSESAKAVAQEFTDWVSNSYVTVNVWSVSEKTKDIANQTLKYTLLMSAALLACWMVAGKTEELEETNKMKERETV